MSQGLIFLHLGIFLIILSPSISIMAGEGLAFEIGNWWCTKTVQHPTAMYKSPLQSRLQSRLLELTSLLQRQTLTRASMSRNSQTSKSNDEIFSLNCEKWIFMSCSPLELQLNQRKSSSYSSWFSRFWKKVSFSTFFSIGFVFCCIGQKEIDKTKLTYISHNLS